MALVYKKAYKIAALAASDSPLLAATARKVQAAAKAEALAHKRSGELAGSIKVAKGRIDHVVYSDDPKALHVEYGHLAKPGRKKAGIAKWVPGLHIMGRAARKVGG